MRSTIVCVDDEKPLLTALFEQLEIWFGGRYSIEKALSGDEAIQIVNNCLNNNRLVSVVITDYIMPSMKGDELLEEINKIDSSIKKIMITNPSSTDGIIRAINKANIYRYISKPWDAKDLMLTILEAIKSYEHEKQYAELQKKYNEIYSKNEQFQQYFDSSIQNSIEIMSKASDIKYYSIYGHSERVAKYCILIAKAMEMNESEIKYLNHAALLHDCGKLIMSDTELSELHNNINENKSVQDLRNIQIKASENILEKFNEYEKIFPVIKNQFEEYDGSGPFNVKENDIPLHSRIINVANYYDFFKNKYPEKLSSINILDKLEEFRSKKFDPKILDVFSSIIKTFES